MEKLIVNILQQKCHLDRHKAILAGISGGPDSLVLLDILNKLGWQIIVAHFNHGLRSEATKEADFVRGLAAKKGLPYIEDQADTASFAASNALSIEEAARHLRYGFLFAAAQQHQAQAVVVAHTADDQVETVLMHFIRGSGLSGLRGMPYCSLPNTWSQQIPIVRPLLDISREEILSYCLDHQIEPVTDPTNQDLVYFRNRIRHELLPYLESYNPAIKSVLHRTAQVLAGDYEFLARMTEAAWNDCLKEQGLDYLALNRPRLLEEPLGIRRYLVRKAISLLRPGLRDIDFQMVERILALLENQPARGRLDVGAGLFVLLEGSTAWLAFWAADLPDAGWPQISYDRDGCSVLELKPPGKLSLNNDWVFHAQESEGGLDIYPGAVSNTDPFRAWIDADRIGYPLLVRCRRPGDRFLPLGMGGKSVKLSDYLINVKLPERARSRWPIVASGDEIVWIPGFRLAHPFRVRPETNKALILQLVHISSVEGCRT
jgi:tRNA(Ile)-lysidine synthase